MAMYSAGSDRVTRWHALTLVSFGVLITTIIWPSPAAFASIFPKMATLAVATSVLLAWKGLHLMWPEETRRGEWRISHVDASLLLLVLAIAMRVGMQGQLYLAMWGTSGRNSSGLLYLALAALSLLVGRSSMRLTSRMLHNGLLVAGSVPAGYGIVQAAGLDPIKWTVAGPISTFGNIDQSSSWFAIVAIAALAASMQPDRGKFARVLVATLAACCLYLVVVLYRSPWRIDQGALLVTVGVLALGFSVARDAVERVPRRVMVAALTVGVVLIIIVVVRVIPSNGFRHRLWLWRAAWEMFLRHPLQGVGLARFGSGYLEFRTDAEVKAFGTDGYADDAHGVPWQILGTGGLLLFLPYANVMFRLLLRSLQTLREHVDSRMTSQYAMAIVFVLYCVQASFSPEMVALAVWGWIAGAVVYRESQERTGGSDVSALPGSVAPVSLGGDKSVFTRIGSSRPLRSGTGVALVLVGALLGYSAYRQIITERDFERLRQWGHSKPIRSEIRTQLMRQEHRDMAEAVIRARPSDHKVANYLVQILAEGGDADGARLLAQYVIAHEPSSIDLKVNLAELYRVAGRPELAKYWLGQTVQDAPRTPKFWMFLADAAAAAGDSTEARTAFARAMALAAETSDSSREWLRSRDAVLARQPFLRSGERSQQK